MATLYHNTCGQDGY